MQLNPSRSPTGLLSSSPAGSQNICLRIIFKTSNLLMLISSLCQIFGALYLYEITKSTSPIWIVILGMGIYGLILSWIGFKIESSVGSLSMYWWMMLIFLGVNIIAITVLTQCKSEFLELAVKGASHDVAEFIENNFHAHFKMCRIFMVVTIIVIVILLYIYSHVLLGSKYAIFIFLKKSNKESNIY